MYVRINHWVGQWQVIDLKYTATSTEHNIKSVKLRPLRWPSVDDYYYYWIIIVAVVLLFFKPLHEVLLKKIGLRKLFMYFFCPVYEVLHDIVFKHARTVSTARTCLGTN